LQVDALRDGGVVRSVRPGHGVVVAEVRADARARRLVTRGEVELTRNRAGRDVERRLFSLEVLLLEALLLVARRHHVLVHLLQNW
jgi:hypothetical protein